ncbi:hypothetical protein L226DRAFT_575155 [Lentinus tigrinus ALCF2SS1-7]|uniref:uncharacterized protein n=1 Tax=Lentinus tigrinus ALCF2SS1-7 TaxID=1328758 RepID=UPI0011662320|nr:hypothetical protein L226DRAFT_575155 [Lentinus tigrinus ALCF2SS1-7]
MPEPHPHHDVLQFVNTLPHEVLTAVFEELQGVLNGSAPLYDTYTRTTVLRITWICRYWRDVALATSRFWSIIVDSGYSRGTEWLSAFLERSRGCPLHVGIQSTSVIANTLVAILAQLIPHAHRLRTLHIQSAMGQSLSSLLAPFTEGFPSLEEVNLSEMAWPELLDLSHARFPRLRKVTLTGAPVPWNKDDFFCSLQVLILRRRRGSGPSTPQAAALFHILRRSPDIQVLKLDGHIHSGTESSERLLLADMREMELSGMTPALPNFLDRLTLPSLINMHIAYFDDVGSSWDITSALPRQTAYRALLSRCSSLAIDISGRLACFHAKPSHGFPGGLKISGTGSEMVSMTAALWEEILDAFSGSPLSEFEICYHSLASITSEMWSTLTARFPNLAAVSISAENEVENSNEDILLLDTLLTFLTSRASSGGELYGSHLRTLTLSHFTLDKPVVEALVRMLSIRNKNGGPLQRLAFRACFCRREVDVDDLAAQLEELVEIDVRYDTNSLDDPPNKFQCERSHAEPSSLKC